MDEVEGARSPCQAGFSPDCAYPCSFGDLGRVSLSLGLLICKARRVTARHGVVWGLGLVYEEKTHGAPGGRGCFGRATFPSSPQQAWCCRLRPTGSGDSAVTETWPPGPRFPLLRLRWEMGDLFSGALAVPSSLAQSCASGPSLHGRAGPSSGWSGPGVQVRR